MEKLIHLQYLKYTANNNIQMNAVSFAKAVNEIVNEIRMMRLKEAHDMKYSSWEPPKAGVIIEGMTNF